MGTSPQRLNRIAPMIPAQVAKIAKRILGQRIYNATKRLLFGVQGGDRLGPTRRLTRIYPDDDWGRGLPISRFYTSKRFLPVYMGDIRGRVLEFYDSRYTQQFGKGRVTESDVLSLTPGHPGATIIADLTKADHIPSDTYDCVIITFVLQFIYDINAAMETLHRILKPGGVALATFDSTSRISRADMDLYGEYWKVTTASARRLFEERFPSDCVTVKAYGNVLSVVARLHGFVSEDFSAEELDYHDPDIEMIITVRAVKPAMDALSCG
jgi:SAM-dependent methyltransferase